MRSKTSKTSAEDCAARLRVLADPTRLEVLRQLLQRPQHVHELNDSIGIAQNLLSHHLRVLREAGMVETERDGKAVLYRVTKAVSERPRGNGLDLGCCTLSFD